MIKSRSHKIFASCLLSISLLVTATAAANGQNVSTVAESHGDSNKKPAGASAPTVAAPEPVARTGGASVDEITPLTRDEALRLALQQASTLQQAQLGEQSALLDLKQSKAALLPRLVANPSLLYTSPSLASPLPGAARQPSFLGADAIYAYQGLTTANGEIDISGRLHTAVRRNQALVEAARAGTEIARRDLVFAVNDAYLNFEVATARRRAATENLRAAAEFEANVKLNLDAGEVAPVELTRANLQTLARRDELEQAQASESGAANALRALVGYSFDQPIAATDLLTEVPQPGEIQSYSQAMLASRPELGQFDAQTRAAEQEIKAAQRERRPQITYLATPGFLSDSLNPSRLKNFLGTQTTIGVTFLLFDAGASRARETQARLRAESLQNQRTLAERQFAQAFFTIRSLALSAFNRIKLSAQAIDDAKSNLTASLARYRAGEALIIEVTDAQNTLIARQTALYQAIFDYQSARVRLLQLTQK